MYRGAQYITRTLEVGQGIILITEVGMVTTHKVIRGMQEIIVIIEGIIIVIRFMIGIGVGHLTDRIEVGEMIEVWVIVGWDQVQEQVWIGTGLGVLNVGNMTILQGNFCQKLGGNDNGIKDCRNGSRDGYCLTPQQTDFIYKKIELGSLINKEDNKGRSRFRSRIR